MGNKSQAEEFKRVARELECDEDEGRFNERLKRIAREGGKKAASEKKPKSDKGEKSR